MIHIYGEADCTKVIIESDIPEEEIRVRIHDEYKAEGLKELVEKLNGFGIYSTYKEVY